MAIKKKTKRFTEGRNHGTRIDEKDMRDIGTYYAQGMSYENIANLSGRSVQSVKRILGIIRHAYKMRSILKHMAPVMMLRTKKKNSANKA